MESNGQNEFFKVDKNSECYAWVHTPSRSRVTLLSGGQQARINKIGCLRARGVVKESCKGFLLGRQQTHCSVP